ncbi:MAG TPA: polyprenyl diphosphate synthase [Candidatus Moranbacteria bacterium]|nr:polyprenyl diphosphate synthase [Candidatus Moranbacteria bacterium]HRZ33737.1 polyprenyl diphosphate synthase [Candidatus Moranbacteria bacterium]
MLNNGKNSLPNHVVIIPDGNRRWAKEHGLKPWKGHEAGAENTEKLLRKALDLGIKCFSVWGSSLENLKKRPIEESRELLRIYEEHFTKLLKSEDIHKHQVKINFIGHWEEQFPDSLKKVLYDCLEATKNYSQNVLNFFLAYSGDDEMASAIKQIINKEIPAEAISADTIKENLMTKSLPAVDFMIRTGGEPHLSAGFMMWDTANAQLYFSEKYYPDFGIEEFEIAINDFLSRGRRLGK